MTQAGDPWFQALVGQWWTPPSDLGIVGAAATKRQTTSTAWHNFSEQLRQELSGSLNPELQKGMAADSIREAFTWGADQASDVAETNGTISKAHGSAHHWVSDLNSRLETIAHDGKTEINNIQASKDLPPIKLGKIVDVVMRCQQDANSAAAPCTQNIFEAMQTVVDRRGIPKSARQFAQDHGIDTTSLLGSPSKEAVTQQVKDVLNQGGPTDQGGPTEANPPDSMQPALGNMNQGGTPPPGAPAPAQAGPESTIGTFNQAGVPPPASAAAAGGGTQQAFGNFNQAGIPGSAAPAASGAPAFTGPGSIGQPGMNASLPMNSLPTTAPANAFGQSALAGAQPPNGFMQGFDHGLNQGAPTSAALNNVPPVTGPVQPQVPVQPPVSDVPASTAPATAPAVDPPPATATPSVSHSAVTDPGTTYLAGPAAAASAPAAPIGSLPTYGSDIRPPMPTISAPTLPSGPAATPSISTAAAPVSPSAGAGGLAQPVVRQPTAAPLAHPAPAGIGEQAVVATAGGAAAGAASAHATAKTRLRRLVDFVANQEPRLRWAAGDQTDGTTLLVTDLASGWIPPGIALPSVVTLLDPGDRRGDIESLLGQVSASASYSPVHYLPESAADDAEPIPTSPRPRQVPAVDELGWELGQATNWRDGLPQMAHTLAKAASTGTGVVDNEVEFLHQHLATLRDRVLDAYPDDVDGAAVANWQLLASIEALAASDGIGANYHFAWFQALNYVP
jgi:Family of unknown function (DUF5631)/Family of unknown function (DUF5632)